MTALADFTFEYMTTPLNDVQVQQKTNPKTGRTSVTGLVIQDEQHESSERFWTSLFARFGIGKSVFKYFGYDEVFGRIAREEKNDRIRVCIERNAKTGKSRVQAASIPTRPLVGYDELVDMLTRYQGEDITYHDGVVESTHVPRTGGSSFEISGDVFNNRFMMSTPVDGYGKPSIYLSLFRQICENGMVGMSPTFRSQLSLGKGGDDVGPAITRALDGFGNDEGYAALRQRMEASTASWASVNESTMLYKLLVQLHSSRQLESMDATLAKGSGLQGWAMTGPDGKAQSSMGEDADVIGSPIIKAFHTMTGDTSCLYGLANLEALSIKRQRTLPVKATVYDTINFATEVATHYAKPEGARKLNAFVGTLVANEYDMENTREEFEDFQDFFIGAKLGAGLTGSSSPHINN